MQGIFDELYESESWRLFPGGGEKGENPSRSGSGSDLVQTEALRRELPALLTRIGARSILDIPCGDFSWMSRADLGVDSYLGADVVPEVIERNRQNLADQGRAFHVPDITRSRLPQVDVVFSRDRLVHFCNADGQAAVDNVRRSGSGYPPPPPSPAGPATQPMSRPVAGAP